MARLTEETQIAVGFVPSDLAAAAQSGDWVSLKNYDHVAIVLSKAAGAVGEIPTITVQQAQDVAGTGAKGLNFTRIDVKNGADLFAIGQFTKVTQAAASTYAIAAGNTQVLYVIEFDAQELDKANGFDCIRATFNDVGVTAQLGAVIYILSGARYAGQYPPSAIVD
ncbi:MAG: hypothetical protein V4515_12410 [Chloroflexota bacterium]